MIFANVAGSQEQVSRIGLGAMGLGGSFGKFDENDLVRSVLLSMPT